MAEATVETPQVLFEDNHCLVVNKPARMLTASDKTGDSTLLEWCRGHVAEQKPSGKAYVVPIHFLDRPVSGVVIFAKSSKAAARLNEAFREHVVTKIYFAICEGNIKQNAAQLLKGWIVKDHQKNISKILPGQCEGAKYCELAYEVEKNTDNLCSVIVRPKTGRSHQIRCQMANANLPLYGDKKYGSSNSWAGRIALHARSLIFPHPTTKEMIEVTAPLPDGWDDILY